MLLKKQKTLLQGTTVGIRERGWGSLEKIKAILEKRKGESLSDQIGYRISR